MNLLNEVKNGARILVCLRRLARQGKSDLPALCAALGIEARNPATNTIVYDLCCQLREMRELGLVKFSLSGGGMAQIKGQISVAEQWTKIQTALGKPALEDLARVSSYARGMALEPVFGHPKRPKQTVDLFVMMPFTPKLKPVYDKHLKKVAKKLKLSIRRGDDIFSAHPVMDDIWADIHASRLMIADCTGRNANVFYEIGMAHTVGKPVILITQNKDDMPFDVKHVRFLDYAPTASGMKALEINLERTIKETLSL
jgi:hypothetical protein